MMTVTADDIDAINRQARRAREDNRQVMLNPNDCMAICSLAARMLKFQEEQKNSRGNW